MLDMQRKLLITFIVGAFLANVGWALYFTRSRIDLKVVMRSSYSELMLLITAESFSGLLSLIWGYIGDRVSRRGMIKLGLLSVIPMMLLGYSSGSLLFITLAALANVLYSIAQPSVMALVVIEKEKSGRRLGVFNGVGSLGWAVGSLLMAYLSNTLGSSVVYLVSSLLMGLSLLVFLVNYPASHIKREGSVRTFLRKLPFLAIGVSLAYIGIAGSSTILSIKLYYELGMNDALFALFYGVLPSVLGASVDVMTGIFADKVGGVIVTLISMISYAAIFPLLYMVTGILMGIIWVIPIYPLFYLGVGKMYSDMASPEYKATAMGAVSTTLSLGGMGAGLIGPLADHFGQAFSVAVSAMLILLGALVVLLSCRSKIDIPASSSSLHISLNT